MAHVDGPPPPPEPPPPPPPPPDDDRSFLDGLGARAMRRAEPRLVIAIAAAGCALVVLGVIVLSGDNLDDGGATDRLPGILLSAATIVAGFVVVARYRSGPLATAGTLASAAGVPPLMFFVTYDADAFPPYSTEAILVVSSAAWAASWAFGPGRGRPIYLGAALVGAWAAVLEVTEGLFSAPLRFFALPFLVFDVIVEDPFADESIDPVFDGFNAPDPTVVGVLSLTIGVAFLVAVRRFDGAGRHGVATPFAVATVPALVVGVAAMGDDVTQAGAGLLAVVAGVVVATHGATLRRRATTWVGGGGIAIGLAALVDDLAGDGTIVGVAMMLVGVGTVAAAAALARSLREPDEMDPGPSVFDTAS